MQQTCNTRATHVQHTCNTTSNTTTFPVNFQSKWLSGHFRRPKATSKGKGENFAPSRENHRNLQQKCSCCTSCCTCVARVLHVCCTCVARVLHVFSQVFLWGGKNPLLATGSGSLVYKFRGRRKISSGKRNTCKESRQVPVCMASAICHLSEPCDSSPSCCQQRSLPLQWTTPRTVRNSRGPSQCDTNHGQWCRL